ncbi:MAG: NAD-dependent epimerase/dehydratase family protein [Caldisphaera sp.]|nr:GDP-mannose 4,6-dehydratase [Caldisphaera sp.]
MIIVTGGAGFIGSNLVDELINKKNEEVIVIDNLSSGKSYNLNKNAKLIISDVSKYNEIEFLEKFKGEEIKIVHLAAIVGVDEVRENPLNSIDVNVKGTYNMMEIARKLDSYITIASSAAIYGEKEKLPIDEEGEKKPINLYGYTKLVGEQILSSYMKEYSIKGSSLRLFNVYGERMKGGQYSGVIHNFIVKILNNERPIIHGDGLNTRDFIYVKDVAIAFIKAIEKERVGFFNIGSGKETKIIDLLKLIEEITNKRVEPIYDEPRKNDIRRSVADIRKAKEFLSWEPSFSLYDGLKNTINYYTKNLILNKK